MVKVYTPVEKTIAGGPRGGGAESFGGGGGSPRALAARDLRAAMRKDGKIYSGKRGEVHADVYVRNQKKLKGQFEEGFTTPEGAFLTRGQALTLIKRNAPEIDSRLGISQRGFQAEGGRATAPQLEAIDYNRARNR